MKTKMKKKMKMNLVYKDFKQFSKYDFLIMIPSSGRVKTCNGTLGLFPHQSCLYVHEEEVEEYRKYNKDIPIVTHKVKNGYGGVVNSAIAVAKKSKIQYLMVIDDDMSIVSSLVGNRQRTLDLSKRYEAVVNAVQVMSDIDVYLYLFSTSSNIIKYQQHQPYKVGFSLPQGVYIVNPQKIGIKYNESYHYYEDFDFCMEYILKHRYYIIEQRILMTGTNVDALTDGGCNSHRTARNEEVSRNWIQKKWKSHCSFAKNSGGNIRPTCNAKRVATQ